MVLCLGGVKIISIIDTKSKEYRDVMEEFESSHDLEAQHLKKSKIKYFLFGFVVLAIIVIVFFGNSFQTKYVCSDGRQVDDPDICSGSNPQVLPLIKTESTTCYSFKEARSHIGETGCIKGEVVQVFTSAAGNTFLNYCSNYKTCPFSAVIFSSDSGEIPNPQKYSGKNVEITGLIRAYQGNAEIIIKSSDQVKIK